MSFPPLQSAPLRAFLASRLGIPSLGFSSLFATSTGSVSVVPSQFHDSSVLDVSHVSDGFIRSLPCGSISPHSHVQGFPSGVCSPRTAGSILRHLRALLSFRPIPCRRLPVGASPRPSPAGPCSVRESVTGKRLLGVLPTRTPLGFSSFRCSRRITLRCLHTSSRPWP
jgi:hypothetical protein